MNRFFKKSDTKISFVGDFKLPRVWWSRPYEYAFALTHLNKEDTILDVGCGIEHPFKTFAGTFCKKVVAIDTNEIIKDIKDENVVFACADILDFKTDTKFDKIFIISTLEQTQEFMIEKFENMKKLLNDDGKIIITSDYPSLDPQKIIEYAEKAGFVVDGEVDYKTNEECIYNATYKLYCYAMILKKKEESKPKMKVEDRKTKVDKPKRTKPTTPKRTKKG